MTDRDRWYDHDYEAYEREGRKPRRDTYRYWPDEDWTADERQDRYAGAQSYPTFRKSRSAAYDDTDRDIRDRSRTRSPYGSDYDYDAPAAGVDRRARQGRYAQGELRDPDRASSWPVMGSAEEQFYGGFGGDPERNRRLAEHRQDERSYRERARHEVPRRDRGAFDRARDEVASWFGGHDAEDWRETHHRGRGPAGYARSDERISEDVHDRLTDDAGVDASGITVSVENCEVTLNGSVPTRYQKRRAEDCVEGISGVRHVQNNLRVQESG